MGPGTGRDEGGRILFRMRWRSMPGAPPLRSGFARVGSPPRGGRGVARGGPPRRKHRLFRPRAAGRRSPGRPGRGARCHRGSGGGARRHARGFLLDAPLGLREAARALGAVRPSLPHLLAQAGADREADRADVAGGAAGQARGAEAGGRGAARQRGAAAEAAAEPAAGADRVLGPPHHVRPRGAAG